MRLIVRAPARLPGAASCSARKFCVERFALGAVRSLGWGKSLRLVRYGIGGAAKMLAWCTLCDCRGGFFRLVHSIPRRDAPRGKSLPMPPRTAHQERILAEHHPAQCTSCIISLYPKPLTAPSGDNLRLRHPTQHQSSGRPLFYRYVSSRRCRAALYFRSRRMRSVLARKLRPSYGVSKSTKSRNVRSSASTVQTSSIISGYW